MATTGADRAIVDTNVLLAATDQNRSEHGAALAVLNGWPSAGTVLYTSGQIMREYLAVATRPTVVNGLGLRPTAAVANVRMLRERLQLLPEDGRVAERLLDLIGSTGCAGKQVHDANLVATMLIHGVDTIVTANVAHFERFSNRVNVFALARS